MLKKNKYRKAMSFVKNHSFEERKPILPKKQGIGKRLPLCLPCETDRPR